jgi:hypothetical protein
MFDALECLAAMCSHVPNKGEQMVRYYGYYSNLSRGKRKKQDLDEWIPCILVQDKNSKEYRRNWARLIQKICFHPRGDRRERDRADCDGPEQLDREQNPGRHKIRARCKYPGRLVERSKGIAPDGMDRHHCSRVAPVCDHQG